jgi:uncharacterized alkaline shock family protein YloU
MTDPLVIQERGGSITVTAAALTRLVAGAVDQVAGARLRRPRRGVDVRITEGRAEVSVELAAGYGDVLPELAAEAQERIADALQATCELDVGSVDVTVAEVR